VNRARASALARRLEPLLWVGVGLFFLARFGPQVQAWTGWGPPAGGTPVLNVSTLTGDRIGPEDTENRVQVITFWATWCRVCSIELPAVERIHRTWTDGGEVVVIGLSIDQGGSAEVLAHAQAQGYTFPQALADPGIRREFGGIQGVPTTFVLDRNGVVRARMVGVSGPGTLQRLVRRLVEEPAER
jgi:cytochrome c biogenesis protein CcmG, thiol:disulfide interchange protein DsbE